MSGERRALSSRANVLLWSSGALAVGLVVVTIGLAATARAQRVQTLASLNRVKGVASYSARIRREHGWATQCAWAYRATSEPRPGGMYLVPEGSDPPASATLCPSCFASRKVDAPPKMPGEFARKLPHVTRSCFHVKRGPPKPAPSCFMSSLRVIRLRAASMMKRVRAGTVLSSFVSG